MLGVAVRRAYGAAMTVQPLIIPQEAKDRLKIMFIAKHAKWGGGLHPEDGNHALYHVEVRTILEQLGLNLTLADKYDALFADPGVDFVFPLLNRGGFLNSEMMLPLLCTRLRLPYLGASPILRGLSDDKHLTKLCAVARGIPTAPWKIFHGAVGMPRATAQSLVRCLSSERPRRIGEAPRYGSRSRVQSKGSIISEFRNPPRFSSGNTKSTPGSANSAS